MGLGGYAVPFAFGGGEEDEQGEAVARRGDAVGNGADVGEPLPAALSKSVSYVLPGSLSRAWGGARGVGLLRTGCGRSRGRCCRHHIPTGPGRFRADALATRVPRTAWQKLSAGDGAKGYR